jgi:hypothetical protein
MADFTVAHDAIGQTDVEAGRPNQRVRILRVEPIITGLLRLDNRVGRVL